MHRLLWRAMDRKQERENAKLAVASEEERARARRADRRVYMLGAGMVVVPVIWWLIVTVYESIFG